MQSTRALFVCLGNICRSPTAEGVFRHRCAARGGLDLVECDSAGTAAYHVGEPPDARAQAAALGRGVDLSAQRARQVAPQDFSAFDFVLAMDAENLAHLRRICPPELDHRLGLFLDFAPQADTREVPDPYYGGTHGFERVLDLVEAASDGLIAHIRQQRA